MDPETQALWNAAMAGKITDRTRVIAIQIAAFNEAIAEHQALMAQSKKLIDEARACINRLEAEATELPR